MAGAAATFFHFFHFSTCSPGLLLYYSGVMSNTEAKKTLNYTTNCPAQLARLAAAYLATCTNKTPLRCKVAAATLINNA